MSELSIRRTLRRIPLLRKAALLSAREARAKRRQANWEYAQTVLSLVGLMTIQWAGVERLLDELIAFYQHHGTDLSREHPRSLSSKLEYLKLMQRDERLPDKTREFLRSTRITAKRLGNSRHDIIHGLLHRVQGKSSIKWRTQRIIYEGPLARATQRNYHNNELADIAAEISDFQTDLAHKVWVMTQTDHTKFPASDIEKALRELGLA